MKNQKILFFFVIINFLHLSSLILKISINLNDFLDFLSILNFFSIVTYWLAGYILLWVFLTVNFFIYIIKKIKNVKTSLNKKFLQYSLIATYLFLMPIFLINFSEVVFSSTKRTLLMVGAYGLFLTWLSFFIFISTTVYILGIIFYKKNNQSIINDSPLEKNN